MEHSKHKNMTDRRGFLQRSIRLMPAAGLLASLPLEGAIAGTGLQAANAKGYAPDDLAGLKLLLAGKAPLKWVFAGDSITHGAKHTFGARSYPEIFGERLRWEMKRMRDVIINTAISGNTSADILGDYDWRIGQFSPAAVFIMIGTNDASVKKNISLESYRRNLEELVGRIRADKAIPVLQTPNIILTEKAVGRELLKDYVTVIREVAASRGTILVDHWAYWTERLQANVLEVHKWMNDELHPNGRGHDEMARHLFRTLDISDPAAFTCMDHWQNR
jgi:lysophospholipase L1-like esterase